MHFGFALDSSDTDLLNIDLLDIYLDLLDTDIPNKQFLCLQDLLKTFSRHAFKTSSKHVFKTSSRHVFKKSSRHLQRNNFTSSKTSSKTSSRRLCKTSSRRLGRRKIVTLKTCWRRLEDVSWRRVEDIFKTNKCLLGNYLNVFQSYSKNIMTLCIPKLL